MAGSLQLLPRSFDPRLRPWYQQALPSPTLVLSSVLRLALGERLGVILSRRLPGGRGVVGASFEIETLERQAQKLDPASLPGPDAAATAALLAEAEPAAGGKRSQGTRLVLPLWFTAPPEEERVAFSRTLSRSASVALETRGLLEARLHLFDGFIHLIANAIDAKSPYTCCYFARVPEITRLLAEAACVSREGPFASFELEDEGWEAIHVASLLHDCGKVTTPEHEVDKVTKLKTITDRIHEGRMRFELLKAEAASDHWRAIAAGADPGQTDQDLKCRWVELDGDFPFVAACNLGGESMEPDSLERLRRIAARTWRRTLDDRLGLSQEELRRRARLPVEPLPVRESLLADRPYHRVERPERSRLAADNPWAFRLGVPELLQIQGELHNPSVARDILNPEERF